MAVAEMKPCPFCGSVELDFRTVWKEYRFVACKDCKAAGPIAKIRNNDIEKADALAAYGWNRRQDDKG